VSSTMNHAMHTPIKPDPHWKGILECAAMEVFSMMAGVELTPFPGSVDDRHAEQTAMVGLAGALCGMVTIRCATPTAGKLATLMLRADVGSTPSMMGDALGELCNMVAGNFKSKVTTLADHCMLSVPTVIWGEDYVLQTVLPHEGFEVVLSFEGDPLWFTLVIHT
jgi:chemotaxis protein CheX